MIAQLQQKNSTSNHITLPMKKISLLIIFALSGCATQNTQNTGSISQAATLEQLTTFPPLSCDSKASSRTEVRARHIAPTVIPKGTPAGIPATEEQLRGAYAKLESAADELKNGVAFETVWKKYADPNASGKGGDLGYFKKGVMVPEFEKVAFCLPVGQISPIVKTVFGFHLIQVTEVR